MRRLYDRLKEYSESDYYAFHMPGHKRRPTPGAGLPYELDITEIDGFDDLHHADGILKEAQGLAAKVYGAEETRFLVNGSTAGILSAILGSTDRGGKVLVSRNCHKSAYHAIELNGLKPVYLYPHFCEEFHMNMDISVSAVRAALMEHSDIQAVIVVSPTYDGVISDVRGIADAAHGFGIPLIVDEAHGAHLGFHPYFEENSLAKGADAVIHSVHKTLPSLTQTALLHVRGDLVRRGRIFRYLDMLQSSSPSYILMASIDDCMHMLAADAGTLFEPYVERLRLLRERLGGLKRLRLLETERYDRSKLVISVKGQGMTGKELYRALLERYHLQMEMAAGSYVIAMTSVWDDGQGFARLENALREIDAELGAKRGKPGEKEPGVKHGKSGEKEPEAKRGKSGEQEPGAKHEKLDMQELGAKRGKPGEQEPGAKSGKPDVLGRIPPQEQAMSCAEALEAYDESGAESLAWEKAVGRIAAEYAYLYPPGCPLIVPGERIARETVSLLAWYRDAGFTIEGLETAGRIKALLPEEGEV